MIYLSCWHQLIDANTHHEKLKPYETSLLAGHGTSWHVAHRCAFPDTFLRHAEGAVLFNSPSVTAHQLG